MKKRYLLLLVSVLGMMASCTDQKGNEAKKGEDQAVSKEVNSIDSKAEMKEIDAERIEIESAIKGITPVTIETKTLREKIKQKWSKIHFYVVDGKVVRIKTYPYEQISKRTEEFYFADGKLILATVEDNGEKEKEEISKEYYFANEAFLAESNFSNEKEYSIKESEAEELIQEAKEYLEIYHQNK